MKNLIKRYVNNSVFGVFRSEFTVGFNDRKDRVNDEFVLFRKLVYSIVKDVLRSDNSLKISTKHRNNLRIFFFRFFYQAR